MNEQVKGIRPVVTYHRPLNKKCHQVCVSVSEIHIFLHL